MFAGLADAYLTFLSAAAVFGLMAFAIAIFRERLSFANHIPAAEAYRIAWHRLRANKLTPEYIANVVLVFATTPLAISAFSAAKQSIPFVHPFSWDARIAALGSALNGGTPMWRWFQPMLAHPTVTLAMDWFYHRFWTAIMLGTFVGGALLHASALRRQYLLSVVLLFLIVGTLGALAFASAGPAYYAQVVGASPNPYAPLLDYLHSVNPHGGLIAVRGEATLWFAYTHHLRGFGYGVSAMPSVHVASATLTALFGYAINRRLGVLLTLIAVCIWIASINLGWHYSLDGYAGAILAYCIWWFAGRATRGARAGVDAS
jgi:hypothetical protein